jgi:hypothetical protein
MPTALNSRQHVQETQLIGSARWTQQLDRGICDGRRGSTHFPFHGVWSRTYDHRA